MANKVKLKRDRALKYIALMEKWPHDVMYVRDLSLEVGILQDVIANELANIDPLIRLFPDYNILQILPYLKEKYQTKRRKPSKITNKADKYESIADFIYQNMTIPGGIVDRNMTLTKEQLLILRRLINQELKK